MAPLESWRTGVNGMYDKEPVRVAVSTQFILKVALAGLLIWAGWHFHDAACGHNLPTWLWINGVGWLVFLFIFALTVLSSSGASEAATFTLAACFPCFLCALCICGPFLLVWFILGNIWVFQESTDTCDPTLYRIAFWYLIGLYVWAVLSCCCFGGAHRYSDIRVVGGGRSAPLLG